MEAPTYTIEDIKILLDVVKKVIKNRGNVKIENLFLEKVKGTLEIIIEHSAPQYVERCICIDDCPEYTGQGFNKKLFSIPHTEIYNFMPLAGYVGKAIILWRMQINK
jgi:hypothetical protein